MRRWENWQEYASGHRKVEQRERHKTEGEVERWARGLAEGAEFLVAHGHVYEKVLRYPMRRLIVLVELARKRVDAERAAFAVNVRAAAWADKKGFKAYIKELTDG